ncbi:LysE family translocator [Pigmentiphaga aceris]|uniref:LysE family translocator n=1 Tax=Pigmentiphaga aceris TaxID=1940612 RepID=A0A5C0B0F3_9BURK|nr:LysE family translocator [Pigmentiphaga aceris]QEI08088.1 LysE family translocator [Pigmentiphaga aceris]
MMPVSITPSDGLSLSMIASLALFALVSSITPGPNNLMLASSGLNFGVRRTMPHIFGISLGVSAMLILVGLGLSTVFQTWPVLYTVLKYVGGAYLLYLAWCIGTAGPVGPGESRGKPFTFLQAAAFQWINPKAWIMSIGIIATYTPQNGFYVNLMVAAVVCTLVNLPSITLWAAFGSALSRVLRASAAVRAFNVSMALLLVASLYPLAQDLLVSLK